MTPVFNTADAVKIGGTDVDAVYLGDELVWSSVPAFDPTDLTWLARYDFSTLGLADSAQVATVPDLSGNSRDLVQPTAGNRMLYKTGVAGGRDVVRSDGVDDLMSVGAGGIPDWITSSTLVIFIVRAIRSGVESSCALIIVHDTGTDYTSNDFAIVGHQASTSQVGVYRNGVKSTATRPADNQFYIEEHVWNGSTHTVLIDGIAAAPVSSSGPFASNAIYLARRSTNEVTPSDFCELALSAAMTSDERAAYRAYLKDRYSTA